VAAITIASTAAPASAATAGLPAPTATTQPASADGGLIDVGLGQKSGQFLWSSVAFDAYQGGLGAVLQPGK
jgi:hypothetical protein